MPKFTSSSITLINDAMASFLEQLAHLTDRYMVQRGEKYPIRPQHIVGGINQGDDSVSFLKESIEYINKNQDNGNHRNSVKKARNSEILPYEVTDDAEKRKITKYFKLKML